MATIKIQNTTNKHNLEVEYKDKLEKLGHTIFTNDSEIHFQGRTINIEAFEQIKKRDPNNPHIVELKSIALKNQLEKIDKSDIIFICNEQYDAIPPSVVIDIIIAYSKMKAVVFLNKIDRSRNPFYDEFMGMDFIYLNGDFEKFNITLISVEKVINKIKKPKREKLLKKG